MVSFNNLRISSIIGSNEVQDSICPMMVDAPRNDKITDLVIEAVEPLKEVAKGEESQEASSCGVQLGASNSWGLLIV